MFDYLNSRHILLDISLNVWLSHFPKNGKIISNFTNICLIDNRIDYLRLFLTVSFLWSFVVQKSVNIIQWDLFKRKGREIMRETDSHKFCYIIIITPICY